VIPESPPEHLYTNIFPIYWLMLDIRRFAGILQAWQSGPVYDSAIISGGISF
jgi:hypothetical protein